ncbi:MAG: hypothetical protein UIH27_11125 [Ruminococcus sp.]|nr:hypothetical protein [Ruminococcus sp.]
MKKKIIILAAALMICSAAASCSGGDNTASGDLSNETTAEAFKGKFSDNEFYAESVKQLKENADLTDEQADAAFGVFLDCGLITKEINYVFKNAADDLDSYNVWIDLNQYNVVFDKDKKISKITDAAKTVYYENGKKVEIESTEVLTEEVTEKPTEKETNKTVEKPTEAASPIVFKNYTNYVEAGSNASVTIQGKPNTDYSIHVYYDTTESKAEGLESKTSDSDGYVTWEWKVGAKTTPGTHAITVEGDGAENSVQFEVLEEIK